MKRPRFIGSNGPLITVLAVACAALLAACVGNPPISEIAVGRAAIERATGTAAADAPIEMAAVRDKLTLVTTAYGNTLNRRAAGQAAPLSGSAPSRR